MLVFPCPRHDPSEDQLMRALGFTGTQGGMTPDQRRAVESFLKEKAPSIVHHGDCIGADADFHDAVEATLPGASIEIHPPRNPSKRAFKKGHRLHPVKEYLDRNVDIVNVSDELLAIPKAFEEEQRSGTWFTVRQARKRGKGIHIIYPDGKVVHEQPVPSLF